MKKKSIVHILFVVLVVLGFTQCTFNKKSRSTTTGWVYQDEQFTGNYGYASSGFSAQKNYKPIIPENMVLVEGGTFVMGENTNLVTAEANNFRRRVTVGSFYMDKYEITNLNWREYTHWMELVFGKVAPELVAKVQPKIDKSNTPLSFNEPYFDRYYTHPAFNNYPVVGVTWEQAMAYCQWRTDRLNELMLVKAGVLAPPDFSYVKDQTELDSITQNFVFTTEKYLLDRNYQPKAGKNPLKNAYGEVRKATMGDGLMFPNFRLPTEAEFEFAAYGIKANRKGMVKEGRIYPWNGDKLRYQNSKKREGQFEANFVRGRGDLMGTAGALNDKYATTAPVNAYLPNDFGLYGMAGNVNEWVLDVYRPTSHDEVGEYNPFRGNQSFSYIATAKDENGNYRFKIDSLGNIASAKTKDISNYNDGRNEIQTDFKLYTDPEGEKSLRNRTQIDPTDVLAPRYTNKSRVYKGGSWKDRAYWLNPSTRRYLDQDKSTNDIGFRCVMTILGSVDKQPRKRR